MLPLKGITSLKLSSLKLGVVCEGRVSVHGEVEGVDGVAETWVVKDTFHLQSVTHYNYTGLRPKPQTRPFQKPVR